MNRTLSLLATTLILSACSGGGGGGDTTPVAPVANNTAPVVSAAVSDQAASVGFDFSLSMAGVFSDADGDALTITVDFGGDSKGLSLNGTTLSGIPDSTGDITVTCTATDPSGASISDTFVISVSVDQNAVQATFNGAIDLENLDAYAGQPVPNYITKINDGGNPITDAGATLGRVLFYDTSLSTTGTVSCASCHIQSLGLQRPRRRQHRRRRRPDRAPFHAADQYHVRGRGRLFLG